MTPSGQRYKVKLASGRILGPLDLDRVRLLILKNRITGKEVARKHPKGEWKDINLFPDIALVLIAKAQGKLEKEEGFGGALPGIGLGETPNYSGTTRMLPRTTTLEPLPELDLEESSDENDKTQLWQPSEGPDPTQVREPVRRGSSELLETPLEMDLSPHEREIAREETLVFSMPSLPLPPQIAEPLARFTEPLAQQLKKPNVRTKVRKAAIALAVLGILFELVFPERGIKSLRIQPIRPKMPTLSRGKADPQKSMKAYADGIRFYVLDNVVAYEQAAQKLSRAVSLDRDNVKALAMLASTYLNLIDSTNKDENYFSVISQLIEMSRTKGLEFPETVIAEVEFYITVNKAEAAENRIVEYTKTHQNFGLELFYYLALAFYHRGDAQTAARYLSQIPENKIFTPKIYYLRGLISEKLGEMDGAIREYEKAIRASREHAKSRLRIAEIYHRQNNLINAGTHLNYLVDNIKFLSPKELAQAYYLHGLLNEYKKRWDDALADIERAAGLDRQNHDYVMELYQLRWKMGESRKSLREEARMFYYLSEGEKLVREGKYQEALTRFLEARHRNQKSPLPPLKMGDMFSLLNDLSNARVNYKLATERAPNSIDVWSKYIDILIKSFEWEEAQKAMDKFRKLPVPQSAIDKAAADMYQKQGLFAEAQTYYRKAMAREVIDPNVYIAYANSLMSTKHFKHAPFFFALALRFDPMNYNALIGTAKCIAESESIDRAITMLQDELQKSTSARAELLAAIAELQVQKGALDLAQENIDQAMAASPEYPYSWKIQARIHLAKEGERGRLDKALSAFQSYSDRNPSDPSGYLERYKLFIKKTEYEKADAELLKIYGVYPKFPNLHYYKGFLYAIQGNHKNAIEEFNLELKNNPRSLVTTLALGKEYLETQNFDEALKVFSRAMQMEPKSPEAKHQAAWTNYLIKNYAGAIALYMAALAYDQANPLIYKRLGLAYRESGDEMQAANAFRKYLEMEPDAPDRGDFERYR